MSHFRQDDGIVTDDSDMRISYFGIFIKCIYLENEKYNKQKEDENNVIPSCLEQMREHLGRHQFVCDVTLCHAYGQTGAIIFR